ncbi:MAG: lipase maturation factor family protein [Parachlamydiaceae bacterium]|nr:lipase maturation factor family protein [Parachlamydiaceae bacterium]
METGSTYLISQGLFLKAIAFIYLIAFASLAVQVKGLFGAKGIVPISDLLQRVKGKYPGRSLYFKIPTLFWINASDRTLVAACWTGVILAATAMLGWYPAVSLFWLWILYYSFISTGSPFLNFQWDVLLLEVGFLAFLFAVQSPPPLMIVYLLWFLLFRFLFSSGMSKWLLGSKEWRDLTAMDYHYETQPLPTKLAYYAHQQPKFFSKLSTLGTYFFELVVPIFIFTPPIIRVPVFFLCLFFQLLLLLTGNFAFFNFLTIAMCIPLLPDSYLGFLESAASFKPLFEDNSYFYWILTAVASCFLVLNAIELIASCVKVRKIYRFVHPFRNYNLINSYGLFVNMTTARNEIVIEGSEDGKSWKEYEFKWKPGDILQSPKLVAPHQPRLDWQFWFAALSNYQRNPWLVQFLVRLLEGSEDVVKLMGKNPFPGKPPRYIRAKIYRYHFSDLKTKNKTGKWWSRELIGVYTPTYSLNA